jgi:hypothetical protein
MFKESGYPNLFLIYWIDIEQKEKTDCDEEELKRNAAIIKNNINPRNIYNTKKILKNDKVYDLYKNIKKIECPQLTHDFMEICYYEWTELKYNVSVLFYNITEKWRLCKAEFDKHTDKSLLNSIYRHLCFDYNMADDWDDAFDLELEQILLNLEKKQHNNLKQLTTTKLKTQPFKHQIDNVNKMIESERNPKMEFITDDYIFSYEDGKRVYNYYTDEDVTVDALEKTRMKGMIIMDEIECGKTLQALMLISEQNVKRKFEGKDNYKTLILVPDHLKSHWESESEKHFNEFSKESAEIKTFSELRTMNIKKGYFDRIIVDEIHKLYCNNENSEVYDKIEKLEFNFKHGLTGTPFCIRDAAYYLIRFLCDIDLEIENMCRFKFIQEMYPRIFTRNKHI